MKELSFLEKLLWWFRHDLKTYFCDHRSIFTHFSADIFTITGYDRCSGSAECDKCGKSFGVYVPKNEEEITCLMNGEKYKE